MTNQTNKINLDTRDTPLIIAGLGNPGEKYNKTRHNAGFIFLDTLAEKLGLEWKENSKFKSQVIKHGSVILVKPLTYMNKSGQSLQALMSYYKLLDKKLCMTIKNSNLSEKLLVVHDDLDIDFGKYKYSIDSRAAGNNGVQSIIDHLKTKNFKRLRFGIKSDLRNHISAKDFVLTRFSKEEQELLNKLIEEVIDNDFII